MDIGIIGGADGPTAVFVSGPGLGAVLAVAAAVAAVLIAAGVVIWRAKKKKR